MHQRQSKEVGINLRHVVIKSKLVAADAMYCVYFIHWYECGYCCRCYMPSGKTLWLCDEHQREPRITVLDDAHFYSESESGAP